MLKDGENWNLVEMSNQLYEDCEPSTKRSEIRNLGLDNPKAGSGIRIVDQDKWLSGEDIKKKVAALE